MNEIPYHYTTPEYRLMRRLLSIRHDLNGEYENTDWWELKGIEYFERMWREANDQKFVNRMLDKTEVIPCKWMEDVFTSNFAGLAGNMNRVVAFVSRHSDLLNEVRNRILMLKLLMDDQDILLAEESLKNEILELHRKTKSKPLKKSSLRRELYPFLLRQPQTMSWEEIYELYKESDDNKDDVYDAETANWSSVSPWKSRVKVQHYGNARRWTSNLIDSNVDRDGGDRFDMKEQRKLMTHYTAPRFSFVMDYFFAGRFQYCLAININTRKAFFAIPQEIEYVDGHYKVPSKRFKPTIASAIQSMQDLLKKTIIRNLIMDNEPAWTSKAFQQFLRESGIGYHFAVKNNVAEVIETQDGSRLNHSATAPIDRLIRTLRMMNYNLGNASEIPPNVMKMLIDEYNNSPHSTLSKIIKRPVTPNEVTNDERLERIIVSELSRENFIARSRPEYGLLEHVRVFNQASHFDKVKPKLLPGHWRVIGTKNGLIELEQNGNRIRVNRWMIKS